MARSKKVPSKDLLLGRRRRLLADELVALFRGFPFIDHENEAVIDPALGDCDFRLALRAGRAISTADQF